MNKSLESRTILITGAILALLAVLFGAFGAHGLKKLVDATSINSFTTAVRYQMYHAMACLFLGLLPVLSYKIKKRIFIFFLAGVLLFSGSIYLLVIDDVIGFSFSSIGFLTPLGGLCLILGWIYLIVNLIKIK